MENGGSRRGVVVDDWTRFDEVCGPTPYAGKYRGERGPGDMVYAMRRDSISATE